MALSNPASISSFPSIVLDASITDTLNAECGKPIQFGPDSYKPGTKSHKAQPGPSVWNGETITIPETGVYICIFSGSCETDGEMKGAQIHLNLRQVSESVIAIGSTSIGEENCENLSIVAYQDSKRAMRFGCQQHAKTDKMSASNPLNGCFITHCLCDAHQNDSVHKLPLKLFTPQTLDLHAL